jgi:hypothetical protein
VNRKEIVCEGEDWLHLAKYMDELCALENVITKLRVSLRGRDFFISSVIINTPSSRSALLHGAGRCDVERQGEQ